MPNRHSPGYQSAYQKAYRLKTKYGLTLETFDEMLALQDNKCAICKTPDPTCVDHDHSCCPGKKTCGECVRGVLCIDCNLMLGRAKDNPETLSAAVKYLNR